ncbi:helix-turn-helix transcriptional regulator [Metabacillus niabensis]|uniref:DNA-binding transcriptional regulator YafY n=1 Tax=Metabacillus niabensis TaxID=324854 RepID=A0ABT9Z5Y0_9BACI|nr:YafY family protein [Metabacillus niabensis]MDQ0227256.1 putative DNA-binding transcriptional regulator YafY [Metabacillus niabensis]
MSKAKKLFDLIMYVNTKRSFTAQDVAYEFNISVRTAHRYLAELSDMGIPIYTEHGRNGGYRTLTNRTLPPIIFEENEAFAIFFAFRLLNYYESLPFKINIDSVSRKLYASLPDDTKGKIDRLKSVLLFWNQKKSVPSPYLTEIIEASIENHIVLIEYQSKSENKMKEVKPIGIYATNGFWYMPAYDMEYKMIRLFRVDRIVSLEDTKRVFNVATDLENWLTSYAVKKPVRLYVKLTREGIRQCRSESWLEPEIVSTEDENGYIDMDVDLSDIPFISKYFFRLGTDAKVIEPNEVIDYIKQRARNLISHYQ